MKISPLKIGCVPDPRMLAITEIVDYSAGATQEGENNEIYGVKNIYTKYI